MKRDKFRVFLDILNAIKRAEDDPWTRGAAEYRLRSWCRLSRPQSKQYIALLSEKGLITTSVPNSGDKRSKPRWFLTPEGRAARAKLEEFLKEWGG